MKAEKEKKKTFTIGRDGDEKNSPKPICPTPRRKDVRGTSVKKGEKKKDIEKCGGEKRNLLKSERKRMGKKTTPEGLLTKRVEQKTLKKKYQRRKGKNDRKKRGRMQEKIYRTRGVNRVRVLNMSVSGDLKKAPQMGKR